jgi:hypothetical protein
VRDLDAGAVHRVAAVIRIDALWLAVEPMDMRAGTERLLASVVCGRRSECVVFPPL